MEMIRRFSPLVLVAFLVNEVATAPAFSIGWGVRLAFGWLWSGLVALPFQLQVGLVVAIASTLVMIWFLRKWGLTILLALLTLSFVPGMSVMKATEVLMYVAPGILILALVYQLCPRSRRPLRRIEPTLNR